MAGEAQDAVWPLPKFYFTVSLGSQDSTVSFQEVSGLDTETQPIEYRHGDNPVFGIFNYKNAWNCKDRQCDVEKRNFCQ